MTAFLALLFSMLLASAIVAAMLWSPLLIVVSACLGAVLYRIRGGVDWNPIPGTQAARLAWALPTGAFLTWLADAPWWLAPPLMLLEFLGLLIGHGAVQDLGTMPWGSGGKGGAWVVSWMPWITEPGTPPWLRGVLDFYGLTMVGWLRGAPVCALLWWWSPPVAAAVLLSHCMMGIAYLIGRFVPFRVPGLVHGDWRRPTEAGEFVTGALIWLFPALVASLVLPALATLVLTSSIPGLRP